MNIKERKKLNKIIDKYYHLYGYMYQRLYVISMEVMDKDSSNLDIYLWDEKKREFGPYLFTVQNYNSFVDLEIVPFYSYFRKNNFIHPWDGVKASCVPLYIDETYTLYKFTGITKEDIINCTKHFCKVILDNFFIWNVEFGTDKEDSNQLQFEFMKNEK